MITIGGKEWISSADEIYYGNRKIQEVYYGNKLIYPVSFSFPTIYFGINEKTIEPPSKYKGKLANQIGLYISKPDFIKINKVAFNLQIINGDMYVDIFVSLINYQALPSNDLSITANGFYAYNKQISSTSDNDPDYRWIKNQKLNLVHTENDKYYYRYINAIAVPEAVYVVINTWNVDNAKLFLNKQISECIDYILN